MLPFRADRRKYLCLGEEEAHVVNCKIRAVRLARLTLTLLLTKLVTGLYVRRDRRT
jgi:hypothetical protein